MHSKLKFKKEITLIPIISSNFIVNFFLLENNVICPNLSYFFFNKKINKNYSLVYSLGGEFYSKFKTYQYLHICIFSLNILEYKNFGLSKIYKKLARFFVVLICRLLIKINRKKFYNVITFSNSKWSYFRARNTYNIKKHKVFYPCFKVPKLHKQSFLRYEKRKDNLVILGRVSTDKNIIDAIKIFKKLQKKNSKFIFKHNWSYR